MGLTEPGAGSDVASITTRAERRGDRYVLNGNKMFITNGPIADVAVVYAKTEKDVSIPACRHLSWRREPRAFRPARTWIKMGVRSSHTSELIFEDCEIPAENLIGQEGAGFFMALQTVEWDRSALLAPFVGGMTYVLKKCVDYAKQRYQFGRPIGDFQAIKHKLADIKIFIEAAKSLCYRIAWCKDQGRPLNHLEAAVAKLFLGDWSLAPANDAVVLFGGYGYCHEYEVERFFRDSRLAPIGGGTSEIQKRIISKLLHGHERAGPVNFDFGERELSLAAKIRHLFGPDSKDFPAQGESGDLQPTRDCLLQWMKVLGQNRVP